MPSLRKIHLNNRVYFITASVEQGLLWQCNDLCKGIIKECLASAQERYPIKVCHYLVEGNHIHLIAALLGDPNNIKNFMGYFKGESAHRINRILGRGKRTVWCRGYDSPVLLTAEDVISKIVYIYSNPAKDNLVNTIDEYPGQSSWKDYLDGRTNRKFRVNNRSQYHRLEYSGLIGSYEKEAQRLNTVSNNSIGFIVDHNAWMICFNITDAKEQAKINEDIVRRLRGVEEEHRIKRMKLKIYPIGPEKLKSQVIDPNYISERKGRRMWCHCYMKELRDRFICFARELADNARLAFQKWRSGKFSFPFPPGLYPPSMPKRAELIGTT